MRKPELIEVLARVTALTMQDSAVVVETVFACMTDALVKGDKIELRGFGRFKVRQYSPRIGRNPKARTVVQVPARKVPHFKPGKRVRALLKAATVQGIARSS